jgi:lysophospholipase L1-like esterase
MLKRALEYRPDVVILHLNDSNEFEDEREWRRAQEYRGWHPRTWAMKSVVLRRLYELKTEKVFWRWLPAEIRNQLGVNDADAELEAAQDTGLQAVWRERVQRVTHESLEMIRGAGVRALVVVQARYDRDIDRLQPTAFLERFADTLEAQGVDVVRMSTVVADEAPAEIFLDGAHMRARGHELLAQAIVARLESTDRVQLPAR